MIKYKVREVMQAKGVSTYRIRKENIISQSALDTITNGGSITIETLNRLCAALDCQPGDLLEFVPDHAEPITNAP